MKKFLLFVFLAVFCTKMFAINPPDEGMWLPMFIKDYNYSDMKKLGLKLTPEQMYDINHSSLKDAIVQLGNGFCTGEVISKDGLMLTNHHCGYSFIVEHSTVENDYLKNGFWAMKKSEELPNEGLTVNFLVRMEDVTKAVLDSVLPGTSEVKRDKQINAAISKLKKANSDNGKYTVVIKPFYEGNEYYMFIYITYKDIRLVGAPPSGIGKFGGETDNWIWPRHTGDFCLFRIYTAPDGSPATYSPDNIPLQPKHYLPINLQGIKKGDYAMVWGYPGTTDRFMTSYEVDNTIKIDNPAFIEACDVILPVIREAMKKSDAIKLGYADHFASFANSWKNKQGETASLKRLKVAEKKAIQEKILASWIQQDSTRIAKYGNVLSEIETACKNVNSNAVKSFWYANIALVTSKTLILPFKLKGVKPNKKEKKYSEEKIKTLLTNYDKLMEGTDPATEEKVILATVELFKKLPTEYQPEIFA
ncbi:MAG: S46 family peptidase, partial [Bacteroidales bacterium]